MLKELEKRSGGHCELCNTITPGIAISVSPENGDDAENCVFVCEECKSAIEKPEQISSNHWRCLSSAIWSEVTAVQVLSVRILRSLNKDWADELAGSVWLDETSEEWASYSQYGDSVHKDSNGQLLQDGDSVVLIKDLDVKGGGFTAKRGTVVKNIRTVEDNSGQIEGKVEGQQIVILTQYVKKQA